MPKVGVDVPDKKDVIVHLSRRMKTDNEANEREVITVNCVLVAVFANMSGLINGYTICSIGVALPILKDSFDYTFQWQSYIIASLSLGAAVSSCISGRLNEKFGRRPMIILSCVFMMIGDLMMMVTGLQKHLVTLARMISGFGVGLSSVTVPMYVSECAPCSYRGHLTILFQLSIALGSTLAACFASLTEVDKFDLSNLLMLNVLFAMIQFMGMIFMPESPRWLILRKQYDQAYKALGWMQESSDDRFEELVRAIRKEGYRNLSADDCTLVSVLRSGSALRALIIGCTLPILKQLTFTEAFFNYGSTYFTITMQSTQTSMLLMMGLCGVNLLFTLIAFLLVNTVRRKTMLSLSLFCYAMISFFVGVMLQLYKEALTDSKPPANYTGHRCPILNCLDCAYQRDCGFCYHRDTIGMIRGNCLPTKPMIGKGSLYGDCKYGHTKPDYKWNYGYCKMLFEANFLIIARIMQIAAFAMGLGPLSWTINAEIYPTWARATCMAFSTMIYWILDAFINMTYYSLRPRVNESVRAWISSLSCLYGAVFVMGTVPIVMNKRLEDFGKLFMQKWNFICFKV